MAIKLNATLQRNLTLPSSVIDDDTVVLNMENQEYYVMDGSAAQVWSWLEKPMTLATLMQRIEAKDQIQASVYQQGTHAFLADALDKNLFHILDANAASTMSNDAASTNELLVNSTWQSAPVLRTFAMNEFAKSRNFGVGS